MLNLEFWPRGLPRHLPLPETSLWFNLEVSATRYPRKAATVFYDSVLPCGARTLITVQELLPHAKSLEGVLKHTVVACYSDYLTTPTDLTVLKCRCRVRRMRRT